MRFNVSAAKDWRKCPQAWHNKFVARRANAPSDALEDGTFFHTAAHAALAPRLTQISTQSGGVGGGVGAFPAAGREARQLPNGLNLDDVRAEVEAMQRAGRNEVADAIADQFGLAGLAALDDVLPEWWKPPTTPMNDERAAMQAWIERGLATALVDYEILELETPRSIALGEHTLVGTPDGVLRHRQTGALWLLQYKTVSGYRPLDVLMDEVRVSWYECAYEAMIRQAMPGERIGGTLLAAWRKLTKKARAAGDEAFVLLPISRSAAEVNRALGELRGIADEMAAAQQPETLAWNRNSCTAYNYRCQYFEVCHGSMRLDDGKFVDVEDRYAEFAGDGGES